MVRMIVLGMVLAGLVAAGSPPGAAPGTQPGAAPATQPGAGPAAQPDAGSAAYAAPVRPLRVARGFEPPPTPYAAGHRGVDLAVAAGAVVRAAGAGTVGFAGMLAGRGVVVVRHADGISTEYEPLRIRVSSGVAVARGQLLGYVVGRHGVCPPGRCLHWGARRGGAYFDPLTLLGPLGPVRLLPWSGAP